MRSVVARAATVVLHADASRQRALAHLTSAGAGAAATRCASGASSSSVPPSSSSSSSSTSPPRLHASGLNLYSPGPGMGLDIPTSRPALYQESPLSDFVSRYYYLFKALGVFGLRARVGGHSESVWRSAEEQGAQDLWFDTLGIPRTWMTEHALIVLHVWILNNRFKVDYNLPGEFKGRRMQEQLFERLWEDATLRIRNAGIVEISVNKQLENVQKATFDDLFGYDAAVKADDEDNMEMAAAVWKGIWREKEDADPTAVLLLADYVKRELLNVMTQPKEDVYRGWITWGPVVGETEAGRLARQRRMLEGEWREALDQRGKVFFYHTSTQERRWDMPEEGYYGRKRFAVRAYVAANPDKASLLLPVGGSPAEGQSAALRIEVGGQGGGGGVPKLAAAAGKSAKEAFAGVLDKQQQQLKK